MKASGAYALIRHEAHDGLQLLPHTNGAAGTAGMEDLRKKMTSLHRSAEAADPATTGRSPPNGARMAAQSAAPTAPNRTPPTGTGRTNHRRAAGACHARTSRRCPRGLLRPDGVNIRTGRHRSPRQPSILEVRRAKPREAARRSGGGASAEHIALLTNRLGQPGDCDQITPQRGQCERTVSQGGRVKANDYPSTFQNFAGPRSARGSTTLSARGPPTGPRPAGRHCGPALEPETSSLAPTRPPRGRRSYCLGGRE